VSQTNVDIAKRAIAAFNASDDAAFAALTTADFEWSPSMSPVDGEVFVGREGIARYFAGLRSAWEHFHVMPETFRVGSDLVLVLGRLEGCGRGSGATVHSPLGMAFDVREGLIARIRGYLDHDDALEAVGLNR
jgi:ketosteroid isomerase-like protein